MELVLAQDDEYPNRVPRNVAVSVCMITYNHASFIAQAIESVLMQRTDFPFELCIGEDNSADNTWEICVEYAKRYPEVIRLFRRSAENKIHINGNKTGILNLIKTRSACNGKYIALLEGDDFWIDNRKLKKQFEFMEYNPQWSICSTRCLYWKEDAQSRISPAFSCGSIASYENILRLNIHPHTSTYFYRRGVVFPDYVNNVIQVDLAMLLYFGSIQGEIPILKTTTSVHRINQGGIIGGKLDARRNEIFISFWNEYIKHVEAMNLKHELDIARRHLRYLRFVKIGGAHLSLGRKIVNNIISLFIYGDVLWQLSRLNNYLFGRLRNV